MTESEIEINKAEYIRLCKKHIHRDGLDRVLAYLEKSDFYQAPSSTAFLLNEDG